MRKANEQKDVEAFHKAFDLHIGERPEWPGEKEAEVSYTLIEEELEELRVAIHDMDMVEIADALADLCYVVYGASIRFGINLAPIFDEVHDSNMSKIGGHKREDGKWIKPDTYRPADLLPLLKNQGYEDE